ncbi:MAG: PIN domain-containing protein [Prevotella pectinovora]|jgi:predicted nucleic acid-binding protein|uniref:type II toxin-antitoxin system VapC family toxin n=1 Tax=Prevotella pectinovora TaxID=1602169 RepID=UPI002A830003|nr:PIN domain-containing protein [Prevotella pectinovora]MDY4778624.1 PIN domain-containing protein [Prevotella pectinovora]
MKLFLDTNVLIDFILERPLFYQPAAMIVSLAAERKIDICVSALSVVTANFICIERCKMPLDVYRRKVDFLRNFIEVCSVDSSDINSSYEANWKDFEDGVQYFSAIRSGVDYLVTRNVKDFEENDLKVITVDEACRLL